MTDPYNILLTSAATLGILHTAIGVDHSLPLVVLGKTRGWSLRKTLLATGICGLLHVLSSVAIAGIGLGLGIAGSRLQWFEETRGSFAAWLLVGFGLAYALAAYWKSRRAQVGHEATAHSLHTHGNNKEGEAAHLVGAGKVMPALFAVFVLGPCEALLPLLTASGITLTLGRSLVVTLVFCAATILTMLSLVAVGFASASALKLQSRWEWLAPHTHTLAGLALMLSGLSIQVLGI